MVTGGAVCSNWACTESVRGEVSDGLPYLDACPGRSVRTIQHVFFRLTFTELFFSADRI